MATKIHVPLLLAGDRVVVFGDTHTNIEAFESVVRFAKEHECTTLISVGDFGYLLELDNGAAFVARVTELLEEYGLCLIVVDGNHDDHWALARLETDEMGMGVMGPLARHARRGTRFVIGGTTFLAIGGAYSIDRHQLTLGYDWWPEEQISFADTNRCIDGGPADIVISHDCPDGVDSGIGANKLDADSQANRKALRAICEVVKPKMLLHGHHHHRASRELTLDDASVVQVEGLGRDGQGNDLFYLLDLK
jgi:predicted phosphodiesterase